MGGWNLSIPKTKRGIYMKYALIGFLFIILTVIFHEKRWDRLKAIAYYMSIIFMTLGAISVWVGDFRQLLQH